MITRTPSTIRSHGATGPVVEVQQLLDRCLGHWELAERCLVRFEQKLRADLEDVQRSVDADDRSAIALIAHQIKGSAATIAATRLASAAAALEEAARDRIPVPPAVVLGDFLSEAERFLDAVPSLSPLRQTVAGE